MAENPDESADPDSRQYKIDHQHWGKSKAPSPGRLTNDKPSRGRGRGWRSKITDSPSSPGRTNVERNEREEDLSVARGGDERRKREEDTKERRRKSDGHKGDARRVSRGVEKGESDEAERRVMERRERERRTLEERRREDERKWEEDRGWKKDEAKKETPRRVKEDTKKAGSAEKPR